MTVESEWSAVFRTVRAGMLAVPGVISETSAAWALEARLVSQS
jgi:hypothetical protein